MRSRAARRSCCASTLPAPHPQAASPDWRRLSVADMTRPMTAVATSTSTREYPASALGRHMPRSLSHHPGTRQCPPFKTRRGCRGGAIPCRASRRGQMRDGARRSQAVEKGPVARRRPKAGREAYSLYVERAPEGAPKCNYVWVADDPFSTACSVEDGFGRVSGVVIEPAPG